MKTIPDSTLAKIEAHRPHLGAIIANLKTADSPRLVKILEKRLADTYLDGETHLGALETWHLACCCDGRGYGEM